jgi:uroporphyrinogen-III synthase
MQLNTTQILCTRILNEQLVQKVAYPQLSIECIPFIQINYNQSSSFHELTSQLSLKKLTAIFTSANAVESVAAHVLQKPDWKICCIGGSTKDAVIKHFGEKAILFSAKNASLLSQKIIEEKHINEIIFFCGNQRLDDLPEILWSHNITVHEIIAYDNVPTPHEISKLYDGIMFFSPTAVHSFFSVNTIPLNTVLFSIGKTTTATIQTYCSNKIITSEWPGQENLLNKVAEYYQGIQEQH